LGGGGEDMKKRLEKLEKALPGEELLRKPISRRAFVAGAAARCQ